MQQKGRVQIPYGLSFDGIVKRRDQLEQRKDHKPAYGTIMKVDALSDVGIDFSSGVLKAAPKKILLVVGS